MTTLVYIARAVMAQTEEKRLTGEFEASLFTTMLKLERLDESDVQTEGILRFNGKTWKTLELPWRDNQRRISRIPAGTYTAVRHESPTFGRCIWIQGVPNRSHILIHAGNFHTNTLGCVLVGKEFKDINGDGNYDVTLSKVAMTEILESGLPNAFQITISDRALNLAKVER